MCFITQNYFLTPTIIRILIKWYGSIRRILQYIQRNFLLKLIVSANIFSGI
jgi:hypothetical protein